MLWRTPELDSSSDDITMHHDKKVGLGLGILLVGIVGAFFFREEPRSPEPLPELQSAEILDREISERLVGQPKTFSDLENYEQRYKPAVDLQGIEITGLDETETGIPSAGRKVFDEEFDFLNEPAESIAGQPKETVRPGVSGLAANQAEQHPLAGQNSGPGQDVAVSRSAAAGQPPSGQGMFTADLSSARDASAQAFTEDEQPAGTQTGRGSSGSPQTDVTDPPIYIVQQGDTLTGIASRLRGEPSDYRTIFDLNRDQLSSPDDLRPGMRLRIPRQPERFAPPTAVSLTREQQEPSSPDSSRENPQTDHPQPPKRDRRVIVPRRVRLNEPIANKPASTPVNQPRARFKLDRPETESNDALPTLEGLEPLDVPH